MPPDDIAAEQDVLSDDASDFSATTNMTSRTEHEIRALLDNNVHELPEELVVINDACSHILRDSILDKGSAAELSVYINNLQAPRTTARTRLVRRMESLRNATEPFEIGHSIRPLSVVQALLDVRVLREVGTGPWRPDDVLFKANLAHLACQVLCIAEDTGTKLNTINAQWAKPFMSGMTDLEYHTQPGYSRLVEETIAMSLEIRLQLAIYLLSAQSRELNFNAIDVIDQVFTPEADGADMTGDNFVLGGISWDRQESYQISPEMRQQITTQIQDRIQHLKSFVSSFDSSQVDFAGLQDSFPLLGFQLAMITWIRSRCNELETAIATCGGAEAIKQALIQEIQSRDMQKQTRLSLPLFSSGSKLAVRALAAKRKRLSSHGQKSIINQGPLLSADVNGGSGNEQTAEESIFIPQDDPLEDADPQSDAQPQQAAIKLDMATSELESSTSVERAPQRQKLIHRQATATRVAPIDETQPTLDDDSDLQDDEQQTIRVQPSSHNGRLEGRGRSHSVIEQIKGLSKVQRRQTVANGAPVTRNAQEQRAAGHAESDDGFETDARTKHDDRRDQARRIADQGKSNARARQALSSRSANTESPQRVQSRARGGSADVEEDEEDEAVAPPSEQQEQLDPTYSPSVVGTPAPPSSNYRAVNRGAKMQRSIQKTLNQPPQTRRAWSREETDALIHYIETIGTSWVLIKDVDAGDPEDKVEEVPSYRALLERSQVNLKDKARNMKMDYLWYVVSSPA